MKRYYLLLLLIFCKVTPLTADLFYIDPIRDGIFLGGVVGLNIASLIIEDQQVVLTPQDVSNLDPSSVIGIDQWVVQLWSPNSSTASDILQYTSILLPLCIYMSPDAREDFWALTLLYAESFLLTSGLTGLVKGLAGRPRPYAYNPGVDMDSKLGTGTVRSFFSGHTSSAFTGAAFFSTVFSLYYPQSRWRVPLVISAYSLAAATGILRVTAGKHFLTDVIVGAAVGTLSGWLVPLLHANMDNYVSIVDGENCGLYYKISF